MPVNLTSYDEAWETDTTNAWHPLNYLDHELKELDGEVGTAAGDLDEYTAWITLSVCAVVLGTAVTMHLRREINDQLAAKEAEAAAKASGRGRLPLGPEESARLRMEREDSCRALVIWLVHVPFALCLAVFTREEAETLHSSRPGSPAHTKGAYSQLDQASTSARTHMRMHISADEILVLEPMRIVRGLAMLAAAIMW